MAYQINLNGESYPSLTSVAKSKGVNNYSIYSYKENSHISPQAAALAYANGPRGEKGRSWTEDEISFLKANAGRKPKAEIAEALDRTPGAIAKMANNLGLSLALSRDGRRGPRVPRNGRRGWTKAEEDYLRDNYPQKNLTQLGRDLGKAKNTVRTHLKVMGLFVPYSELHPDSGV